MEDKRITSVSDYVAIDYHLDRLARDPAVKNKVAHVLCLQGEMKFQFNGSSFRLQKDGLLILPIQALMKSMEPSADFRCVCVYVNNEIIEIPFTPPRLCMRKAVNIFRNPVISIGTEKSEVILNDIREIERRKERDNNFFNTKALYHSVQVLMFNIFDTYACFSDEETIPAKFLEVMSRFFEILYGGAFIHHRKLDSYADQLNVTTKYLSNVMRTLTGKGASYWINWFTISRICYLLKSTSMTFSEVADMFGFSSPSHFYLFFQKHTGMSPSEFRNKL